MQLNVSDLKSGMIGLSGGNSWIQKAIRFFTRGQFSHSFCMGEGPGGLISTVETTDLKVRSIAVIKKTMEPDWFMVWEPTAPQDIKDTAYKIIYLQYTDEWYGYLSYLWFMYRAVCRLFKYEPKRIWRWASGGITCTELVASYLCLLGPEYTSLFSDRDLDTVSPEELYKIMVANPHLFKFIGWVKYPPRDVLEQLKWPD